MWLLVAALPSCPGNLLFAAAARGEPQPDPGTVRAENLVHVMRPGDIR
jgi:hypothetical protein